MGRRQEIPDAELDGWLEREIAGCRFEDARHGKRFRTLLEQLSERIGDSIPFTCQDWASTKAAYRFLANERVSEDKILAGQLAAPELAFTNPEIYLVDQLVSDNPRAATSGNSLSLYLAKLACLGDYLARAKDPPRGNIVMWRGISRLNDIQLGFSARSSTCG
jgi:hypothetical protein